MDASKALTQSMHHMTATKLAALTQQQQRYEKNKSSILEAIGRENKAYGKVKALLDGYALHKIAVTSNISLANVRRFLDQSQHDQSVSSNLLQNWQIALEQALDITSRKYEHALLFGRLVTEWLGTDKGSQASATAEDMDAFEPVGRKEMYEQRKEWESIVFAEDSESNPEAIRSYLANIFESTAQAKRLSKSPLDNLRAEMASFRPRSIDVSILERCIAGVLKTDLLSDAKKKTLSGFRGNSMILHEMVDVLKMQLDDLDNWSWGTDAVAVDVRRALNGKYRVYMDEEALQALLLHFVGTEWAIRCRKAFLTFFRSGAWKKSPRDAMDRQARHRRQDFLGPDRSGKTVREKRRDRYQRDFFLLQLPTSLDFQTDNYDETSADPKKSK